MGNTRGGGGGGGGAGGEEARRGGEPWLLARRAANGGTDRGVDAGEGRGEAASWRGVGGGGARVLVGEWGRGRYAWMAVLGGVARAGATSACLATTVKEEAEE